MKKREKVNLTAEQEEFAKLYQDNRANLLRFIKVSVRDEMIADDIMHEIFLEALKQKEILRKHPNKSGWLFEVAKYKIMEFDRKWKAHEMVGIEDEGTDLCEPDEGYNETELKLTLKDLLTEEEYLRFCRYFLWGYSMEKLAGKESVSVNNMRVRITRLKKKISLTTKIWK